MRKHSLNDVHIFEYDSIHILYSPLDKIILEISKECFNELSQSTCPDDWVNILTPNENKYNLFQNNPPTDLTYISKSYDGMTLILTNICNLKCKYCYAEKSRINPKVIDEAMWERISDYFFNNVDNNSETLSLAIHGYGECSIFPEIIQNVVTTFKEKATAIKKKSEFQITTNGTFCESFCDFLIENNFFVNISLDGTPEINDQHRVTAAGKGSYDQILPNIKKIVNSKIANKLMIRSTFTNSTISNMVECFRHFSDLGIRLVHMEPAYIRGAAENLEYKPEDLFFSFIENYKKCVKIANTNGMKIYYGPINFGIGVRFCFHKKKLMADYNGRIIGCLEGSESSGLDFAHYGDLLSQNERNKNVIFYQEKIDFLNKSNVFQYSECKNCLLRYHCAGNCLSTRVKSWVEESQTATCKYSEELFAWILCQILKENNVNCILDFPLNRVW